MIVDKKDRAIIGVLRIDARRPIKDIAKITKIRPSTVHQRIQRMKREGIIEKFTVKLNDKLVGENFIVFMFIKTKPATMLGKEVFQSSHIRDIFGVTGEYDLLLKLKFKDVVEFNDYIIEFRKREEVVATLTMVSTATIKEEL